MEASRYVHQVQTMSQCVRDLLTSSDDRSLPVVKPRQAVSLIKMSRDFFQSIKFFETIWISPTVLLYLNLGIPCMELRENPQNEQSHLLRISNHIDVPPRSRGYLASMVFHLPNMKLNIHSQTREDSSQTSSLTLQILSLVLLIR